MSRKKLEGDRGLVRVAASTPEKLKQMAQDLRYVYDEEGSTGQLLDAIALRSQEITAILQEKSNRLKT